MQKEFLKDFRKASGGLPKATLGKFLETTPWEIPKETTEGFPEGTTEHSV